MSCLCPLLEKSLTHNIATGYVYKGSKRSRVSLLIPKSLVYLKVHLPSTLSLGEELVSPWMQQARQLSGAAQTWSSSSIGTKQWREVPFFSSLVPGSTEGFWLNVPFFRHHKKTLHDETFRYLRCDTFEQPQPPFIVHNKLHDLDEALEWFPSSRWWWLRLKTNLSYNEWLRCNCCKWLRHSSKY